MVVVRVPGSLADELCENDGWRVTFGARNGAADVALEVLAVGSNAVTLFGAPETFSGSLETIRSWFRRKVSETTVEVHGSSEDIRMVIHNPEDVEAALTIVRASLSRLTSS